MSDQGTFVFLPQLDGVDHDLQRKLERAADALGRGAELRLGKFVRSVIVHRRYVRVQLSLASSLLTVADYMNKGQRVRRALERWAIEETERQHKALARKIGKNVEIDWRPETTIPEDFYAC